MAFVEAERQTVGAHTTVTSSQSPGYFAVRKGAENVFLRPRPLFYVLRPKGWDPETNSLFANLVRGSPVSA
jgi:hypothetical protein